MSARMIFHAIVLSVISGLGSADTVYLKNRTQLVGEVQQFAQGELILASTFDDPLVVKVAQLSGIETDQAMTIATRDGRRFKGPLAVSRDGVVSISDPESGRQVLALSEVVAIWRSTDKPPNVPALKNTQPVWNLSMTFGLMGQSGNTERLSSSTRVDVSRTTFSQRLLLSLRNQYAQVAGEATANEYSAGARVEFDITSKIFAYGGVEFAADEFKDLDLRAHATAGGGYFFLRRDNHEFKGRLGLGLRHEAYEGGPTTTDLVSELGYDYVNALFEGLHLEHSLTYTPVFSDPLSDFRVEADTSARLPLSRAGWAMQAGLRHSYDSEPVGDQESLDTAYLVSLNIEF